VRDTKRGQEEITREIPNVAEESLVDLDERGIVRIGAQVKPGDILVGKITPKGEAELTPEDKLCTAIFGEKAKDVMDSSLKVPPGMEGTVIDVKIFSCIEDQVVEEDRGERIGEVRRLEDEEKNRVNEVRDAELATLLEGEIVALALKAYTVEEAIPAGTTLTKEILEGLRFATLDLKTFRVEKKVANDRVREIIDAANEEKSRIEERAEERIDRILQPDELPPGVIQLVKVYLAEKRKISVGDKLAGRHGNKGIVARIVPEEDMPFLPNGRPVDIVLNPLGVPSRMNVGQILETHLGWAAKLLNFYAKTPVFEGANEREIGLLLKLAGLRWAREVLALGGIEHDATPTEIRSLLADVRLDHRSRETFVGVTDASLNALRDLSMSAETQALFAKIRSFVISAGREIAERQREAVRTLMLLHRANTEPPATVMTELEAEVDLSPAESLKRQGMLALAALLAGDNDVDRAASELMRAAGLTPSGKVRLRDGITGDEFEQPVTVGEIFVMKLNHFVADKMHARSIGPYSPVTQQPVAGRSNFGGQRLGEMEVWALEAYGAAHLLQEMLTLKSDDMRGRSKAYHAIVTGQSIPEPNTPESFNVLINELQALGLKVTLGRTKPNVDLIDGPSSHTTGPAIDGVKDFVDSPPQSTPGPSLTTSTLQTASAQHATSSFPVPIGVQHISGLDIAMTRWEQRYGGAVAEFRVTSVPAGKRVVQIRFRDSAMEVVFVSMISHEDLFHGPSVMIEVTAPAPVSYWTVIVL
jgi:hypothetical protein